MQCSLLTGQPLLAVQVKIMLPAHVNLIMLGLQSSQMQCSLLTGQPSLAVQVIIMLPAHVNLIMLVCIGPNFAD